MRGQEIEEVRGKREDGEARGRREETSLRSPVSGGNTVCDLDFAVRKALASRPHFIYLLLIFHGQAGKGFAKRFLAIGRRRDSF
jgi:hypothetical protein